MDGPWLSVTTGRIQVQRNWGFWSFPGVRGVTVHTGAPLLGGKGGHSGAQWAHIDSVRSCSFYYRTGNKGTDGKSKDWGLWGLWL